MRRFAVSALVLTLASGAHGADPRPAAQPPAAQKTDLKPTAQPPADSTAPDEQTLAAIGATVTRELELFSLSKEEYAVVRRGMDDAFAGKGVDPGPAQARINAFAQARMKAAADRRKAEAKPFLDKAAAEKGAERTASGLVYLPLAAGTGAQPKAADTVKVHYTGRFPDGKVFDSSVQRGQPAEFPLGRVIPCWTEGVAKMKVGGKARLVCPADLAYGDRGGPGIPPGSTLVFEVELLGVSAK
ncbi:FKBP-type peptidyl-prolyl cis-trans isomerase [Anaeromyxobacter paludicola]|uniref:Peptidyl-prolyl cis-trans isomerase n=1 Tax=Anaeromyxobacter paludicola TaxID=2918171 RepID=A0ABM7XCL4_9BACT|nr:FKBP-type peptidyl-prolyl cis-trans isomerase [Anaeromyxobacter paludicola]BDG09627.1 peptidyl-prolyl cis-trans isomerase [Anaeromyxobacter paludicola]